MEVLIVGAGAMGTWFGETVADAKSLESSVTFVDVDREQAERAADSIGEGATVAAEDSDARYDLVCVAVPLEYAPETIEAYGGLAEHALVDVAGVMEGPLEAMRTVAPDTERISLHPLFAPERAPGSIAVVRGNPGPYTDSLLAALEDAGNQLVETTADEHDRAMESVQSAAHAAVLAFALAADPVPEGFETPIYDELRTLVEYVTGGTPRVYADIQHTFEGAHGVAEAAQAIAEADSTGFEALHERAARKWAKADEDTPSTPPGNSNADARGDGE
ncbi:prephenate dehydrogenase/arogenate dehydrogenase family protein [Halobacteria archaeon AArc-curdl1]|uniref:Prephenate dehydrogenase/arogenate dehydrogenase family protein n=1 Tax=Natronosalvus hydrolyticus TaxID=2979988 RepID=A0AAP2Z540_9EURY|nr:prephenate dehydrogenase/arogenate dehydrogenase family protein [Halobacteria archaeon AArc-curdl1]